MGESACTSTPEEDWSKDCIQKLRPVGYLQVLSKVVERAAFLQVWKRFVSSARVSLQEKP